MSRKLLRIAAALAGGAVLLGAGAASATTELSAAAAGRVVPFYADSGDPCPMGFTKGTITWIDGFAGPIAEIEGAVVDRPLPTETDTACGEDARFTIATFTAFDQRTVVDSEVRRVDNGRSRFSLVLSGIGIDSVVVQVCRVSTVTQHEVCGKPQEYPASLI